MTQELLALKNDLIELTLLLGMEVPNGQFQDDWR